MTVKGRMTNAALLVLTIIVGEIGIPLPTGLLNVRGTYYISARSGSSRALHRLRRDYQIPRPGSAVQTRVGKLAHRSVTGLCAVER